MAQPDTYAALLQALRVARQQQTSAELPFERSLTALELERALETVESYRAISARWPLEWHNLPTRFWAGLNRLVRRYLRWYIEPIVAQQNAFNAAVAELLHAFARAREELNAQAAVAAHVAPAPFTEALAEAEVAELMALVAERARAEPPASFPELEIGPLLARLEGLSEVRAHWELRGATVYERGLIAVHKLVRRYLRWLVNPLVAQQNAHNAAVVQALRALFAVDAEARAELAAQRAGSSSRQRARGNQR
jgi:hypothetical protein